MVVYRATNIETGEIIEGGARDLARKLGVAHGYIFNAVSRQQKVKCVWFISTEKKKDKIVTRNLQSLLEEWDVVTAPFKKLSAKAKGGQVYADKS